MKLSKTDRNKGILFALGYHLLTWISFIIFFTLLNLDTAIIWSPLIWGLIALPMYFCIKADSGIAYSLSVLFSNIALLEIDIILIMICVPFLEQLGYCYAHAIISIFGLLLSVIDGIICLVQKLMKGRKF